MGDKTWETFQGLNRILESSKWSISRRCRAVESCLETNRDNLRGFFEQCFLVLLRHVFGFDGQGWLWMAAQSGKEKDIVALLDLLSPTGLLFQYMFVADSDHLIQFIFPLERLPTHTQMLMSFDSGRAELNNWPQYRRGVVSDAVGRCLLQLNVFNYYIMWTAYYVLRGGQGVLDQTRSHKSLPFAPQGITNSVRKAVDSLGHFGRGSGADVGGHPYLRLLRSYLHYFLPQPLAAPAIIPAAQRGGGGAPLAGSSPLPAPSVCHDGMKGEVLLNVILEFWLCDGDQPLPTSSSATAQPGVVQQMAGMRAVSYDPPSQYLLDALCVFIRHITVIEGLPSGHVSPATARTSWLPMPQVGLRLQQQGRGVSLAGPTKLGAAAAAPAQSISIQLYRFLRRALSLWPDNRALSPIVSVWLNIIAPWRAPAVIPQLRALAAQGGETGAAHPRGLRDQLTHVTDLLHITHRDATSASPGATTMAGEYSAEWQPHALSHLPFYFLLMPLFVERTLVRVAHVTDEAAIHDLNKVLDVFVSSPALVSLLHDVEGDYMSYITTTPRRPHGQYAELLPWLQEQAHDFEVAATANCYGDTPLTQAAPYFGFFDSGPEGVGCRVRDVITQARRAFKPEVVDPVAAAAQKVLPMDRLAESAGSPRDSSPSGRPPQHHWGIPRSCHSAVHYKGDPMLKPITSSEISWLVRRLVTLSSWINRGAGLDRPYLSHEEAPAQNIIQALSVYLRSRHIRVNLRLLADLRNIIFGPLVLLVVYWILSISVMTVSVLYEVFTSVHIEVKFD